VSEPPSADAEPTDAVDRRVFLAGLASYGLTFAGGAGAAVSLSRRRPRGSRLIAGLRQAVRGPVIEPGQSGFLAAAHVYNERFDDVLPLAVARPLDAADVRSAVRWAAAHDVPPRARSGGHSYAGYSTLAGGIVLDLRYLSQVGFDRRAGIATLGGGAQLIDVYAGLAAHGVTIPAGSCPSVGVAGHALGGGMGLAGRALGLTTDNLFAAELATADGRLRRIDRHSDPELLWALRGAGGGNFGVVTELEFRAHRLPRACAWFSVAWPWASAGDALDAWQHWAPHAREQLTSVFHLETGGDRPRVLVAGQYRGPAGELARLLEPLAGAGRATVRAGDQDYFDLQLRWAGPACSAQSLQGCHTVGTRPGGTLPRESFRAKSDYVSRPLSRTGRELLVAAVAARQGQPGSGSILFDSYGGAINRVAPAATAFVHREALFCIQYLDYGGGPSWLRGVHAAMRGHVSGMAYQNYIDPELGDWQHAYYGANYPRLLAIRRRVDPDHRFNFPQAIGR